LLGRSVGAGLLLLGAELLPSRRSLLGLLPTPSVAASSSSLFFLYGLPGSDPSLPSSVQAASATGAEAGLRSVASELATLPVKSPDQRSLGLIAIGPGGTGTVVSVSYIDTQSGATTSQGTLDVSDMPEGTSLLITPTFAADSTTLCLVLSITVPTPTGIISKLDPLTGRTLKLDGATWVSHHALAYFDGSKSTFTGPFDLADAPSLARVNVTADAKDLFLWTIDEPAAIFRLRGRDAAVPVTRLSVFPLGSGNPRLVTEAPGPWPVNGEPIVPLSTGEVARLAYGTELEIYSPLDGAAKRVPIPKLDAIGAKPSSPTMESLVNGTLFVSAPAIGSALVVDPSKDFVVVASVSYPIPLYASGGPSGKTVLSPAGDVLYVLGDARAGGLAAYETASGLLKESYRGDQHYSGLRLLPSGNLVAVAPTSPRVSFFTPALEFVGSFDTELDIAEIL
jgi:hypothetical protein